MNEQQARWALTGLVVLYVALGTVYSVVTPVFEAPDESLHFFVVKHILDYRSLPVQSEETRGLWAQEGSQPPLYYALGALLVSGIDLSDAEALLWRNPQANQGDPTNPGNKNTYIHPPEQAFPWTGAVLAVHVLRLFSLALGAVTVISVWHIVRLLFPGQLALPLLVTAMTAFIPQFLFITSSVSNDNAMTSLGAVAMLLLLRRLQADADDRALQARATREMDASVGQEDGVPVGPWALVGLVLGLAVLAKLSGLALLAVAAVVIALVAWHRRSWRYAWQASLSMGLVVLALAGWWYVRNLALYGEPTGLTAMWEVVGRRSDFGQDLWGEFRALRYSFWGLFGWFSIALPGWVYRVLDVFSLLALLGLGIEVARWWSHGLWRGAWSAFRYREPAWGAAFRPLGFGLLVLWLGVMFVSLVRWTSLTPGTQGRLIFPALASFTLLFVLGLRVWFLWRARDTAIGVLVLCLVGLAVLTPFLWIAPAYALPATISHLPEEAIPIGHSFADLELQGTGFDKESYRPGESLRADLYWRVLRSFDESSAVMVVLRLVDPLGGFVGVEDSYLGSGTLPAPLGPVGQLLADRQYVHISPGADAPMVSRLSVSLSGASDGEQNDGEGDQVVTIGRIKIVPRRWPSAGRNEVVARLVPDGADEGIVLVRSELAERAQAGSTFPVKIVWKVQGPPGRDYTVFVHVADGAGNVYGYGDGPPRQGYYPTWAWSTGEVVEDEHHVQLHPDTPPGHYRLMVGLYDGSGRVLAYKSNGTRWLNDAVQLGMVEVR